MTGVGEGNTSPTGLFQSSVVAVSRAGRAMLKFIFRRFLEAIPTLFILITISFFMMRLAPGSPFTGERTLSPEVMANIEAKYHLNDPILTQYFSYLKQLAHGDFGPSFKYKDYSVNDLVAGSFPVSYTHLTLPTTERV